MGVQFIINGVLEVTGVPLRRISCCRKPVPGRREVILMRLFFQRHWPFAEYEHSPYQRHRRVWRQHSRWPTLTSANSPDLPTSASANIILKMPENSGIGCVGANASTFTCIPRPITANRDAPEMLSMARCASLSAASSSRSKRATNGAIAILTATRNWRLPIYQTQGCR